MSLFEACWGSRPLKWTSIKYLFCSSFLIGYLPILKKKIHRDKFLGCICSRFGIKVSLCRTRTHFSSICIVYFRRNRANCLHFWPPTWPLVVPKIQACFTHFGFLEWSVTSLGNNAHVCIITEKKKCDSYLLAHFLSFVFFFKEEIKLQKEQ